VSANLGCLRDPMNGENCQLTAWEEPAVNYI
jgi:hypothetical protein